MTSAASRQLIAQAAIVLAVCIGGWIALVKPKIDELARHDQQLAQQASQTADSLNQQSVTEAAARMSAVKARVAEIETRNALADDSSRLYGLIMDIADTQGVHVQSLQPTSVKQTTEASHVAVTRVHMVVQGEYEKIAGFLDSVCTLSAFMRPVGVDISPSRAPGSTMVDLNFSCDLLSFALDDSLASIGGTRGQH